MIVAYQLFSLKAIVERTFNRVIEYDLGSHYIDLNICKFVKIRLLIAMNRPEEITANFLHELDKHILDIISGEKDVFYEIQYFADILCIHPIHLSNTVKEVTGKAPCHHCEGKLVVEAKKLLVSSELTITQIAYRLTYDSSSFTHFFKKHVGQTPSYFRAQSRINNNLRR
jgi:AraC family transcriptional regulator of adaptative response / methylphosphotriester-DNA alkyltransferase methyltransferase